MNELIKQPNGYYCSVNFSGELKYYNYTEDDVIKLYIEKAKEDMKKAQHYGYIVESILKRESFREPRTISGSLLKQMGFDKPYSELVKYIPRSPIDTQYASCDFTTFGKCPNCGGRVSNGMGHKDNKCGECGQLLKWG